MPNFDPGVHNTLFDLRTNSFTLIDGILISKSLRDVVSNVHFTSHGGNISNHLPVEIDLNLIEEISIRKKVNRPVIMWNKLSTEMKDMYRGTPQ